MLKLEIIYKKPINDVIYFIISSSGVYDSLRGILNDGKLDVRVQYMIEVMFAIRKDGFKVCTYHVHYHTFDCIYVIVSATPCLCIKF